MFTKYHNCFFIKPLFFIFRFKTNKLNQLGFTTMHLMPFVRPFLHSFIHLFIPASMHSFI